jgi:hypothetical protein
MDKLAGRLINRWVVASADSTTMFTDVVCCRVLSNSAPTYLEGMQQTLLFTDSIDAMQDMKTYVDTQPKLKERMKRPKFEAFQSQVSALYIRM